MWDLHFRLDSRVWFSGKVVYMVRPHVVMARLRVFSVVRKVINLFLNRQTFTYFFYQSSVEKVKKEG